LKRYSGPPPTDREIRRAVPIFTYHIRDASGTNNTGVLEAADAADADGLLRRPGVTILSIEQQGERIRGLIGPNRKVKRDDVIFFATQLAVMVDTGVTLTDALESIASQCGCLGLRIILHEITEDVKGGLEFSAALEKHPKIFTPIFVALMRASEASGTMGTMLKRLCDYMTQERETRKRITGAMVYPVFMLTFCILVVVGLLVFVMPRFEKIYAGKNAVLPMPTRVLLGISHNMVDHWAIIVGVLGASVAGAYMYFRTPEGKLLLDRVRINIPVIGPMYRKAYLARSLRTMATMVTTGVSMLEGLEITSRVTGNKQYAAVWQGLAEQVKEGSTLAEHLYTCDLVPRTIVQMIDAGEKTGKLGMVMDRVAKFCEDDLKTAIKTLTNMIEPVMIIVMGVVIGGIAMALLLPVFSMSKVVAR